MEVKAPGKYGLDKTIVFLGGVIDNGAAEDWQKIAAGALSDLDIVVLNPRRSDWDPTWVQQKDNPKFREQVEWELTGQESADLNIYVFASSQETSAVSRAPITFVELGLHASSGDTLVCCPKGFYRKGNVDIVCERLRVPVLETLEELIAEARKILIQRHAVSGT